MLYVFVMEEKKLCKKINQKTKLTFPLIMYSQLA